MSDVKERKRRREVEAWVGWDTTKERVRACLGARVVNCMVPSYRQVLLVVEA